MTIRFASFKALALGTGLAALTALGALAQVTRPIDGDPVRTDAGLVSGSMSASGLKTYFGIPFAAPPVRENRWREPQPVKAWDGILTANKKQAECVQGLRSSSINHYFGEEAAAEDCLYLNIWEPAGAKAGAKLPVMVWIYGGAFTGGSASSPIYAGDALAKKGVIYVAINYRLGTFGFLAHPELTATSGHNASGNWGFLDQVAGLKWVQKNIAAFGGDPGNVTIVAQSAGSMSATDLQASPLAKGLFQRIIGMSGTTLKGGAGAGVPLADAEAEGVKLQTALKAKNLADMRSFSSDKVQAAAQQAGVRAQPDIDGYYLSQPEEDIFAAGKQNDVALLTGSTANDLGTDVAIRKATTVAEYNAAAQQMYGDKAAAFLALFPVKTDADVKKQADNVGRNSGFGIGARHWVAAQTKTGKQPAYLFQVSRVQPFTPGATFSDFDPAIAGAYHMGDVPYFLGTYEAFNLFRTTRNWTALDRDLSNKMQDVLVAFAKTGNPSTDAVKFVRYNPANEMRMNFGDTIVNEKLDSKALDFLRDTPVIRAAGRGGRGGPPGGGAPGGGRGTAAGGAVLPPSPSF